MVWAGASEAGGLASAAVRSDSTAAPARRLSLEKCSLRSSSTLRRRATSPAQAPSRYTARASDVLISRASRKISRSVTIQMLLTGAQDDPVFYRRDSRAKHAMDLQHFARRGRCAPGLAGLLGQ